MICQSADHADFFSRFSVLSAGKLEDECAIYFESEKRNINHRCRRNRPVFSVLPP